MGERELKPRLKELYDKGEEVFSISKLDTINNCLMSAYKTYVLHEKGSQNVYSSAGTKIHDVLEAIMNNDANEANSEANSEANEANLLLAALNEELDDMEVLGMQFPNDQIKDGWVKDMTHFCKTYKKPSGDNFKTEEFFLYQTKKGYWMQGYIDLQRINKDGSISIYDYKTSSLYTGAGIQEHGRQLLVYALGKMQEGYDVKSVSWIFLKYCEVRFMGYKTSKSKEKTEISKVCERRKIAQELKKYVISDILEAGYDEIEADIYFDKFKETNDFEDLPEEIRDNYKLLPHVLELPITEEALQETEDYINNTIEKWHNLKDYPHREFTRTQKNGKVVSDTFFCQFLCNFKMCPAVTDYLDQQSNETDDNEEDDDLFS